MLLPGVHMRILKWIVGLPVLLLIGLAILGKNLPSPPSSDATPPSAEDALRSAVAARREIAAGITLEKWSWTIDRFGRVEISGTLRNGAAVDVQDVELECEFAAPSGTVIAKKRATLFERVAQAKTARLRKFLIGYVPEQVKTMGCRAVWFNYADVRG